jgi:hypothetical protein
VDEAHESGEGFLASQGDPAESFEFVEEALDLMALLLEPPVDRQGYGPAGVGLDLRGCAEVIGNPPHRGLKTARIVE